MTFWKLFKASSCSNDLAAQSKAEALREIVDNLVKSKSLQLDLSAAALAALQAREELASTGVGMNVAIPHVKLEGLDRVACSLSVHREGLEWAAVDGARVHVVFTVLRPVRAGDQHDPGRHLEMMTWIAKLGRDADFRSFAMQATTKTHLVELLKEKSSV